MLLEEELLQKLSVAQQLYVVSFVGVLFFRQVFYVK